ncbi:MAG: YggT family protein [Chloroflexota bacterium]
MSNFLPNFVDVLFNILIFAILIDALISWFPIAPDSPIVRLLDDITEPILAPLRRVVPRLGMFDITPIVAMFLLEILDNIIVSGLSRAM